RPLNDRLIDRRIASFSSASVNNFDMAKPAPVTWHRELLKGVADPARRSTDRGPNRVLTDRRQTAAIQPPRNGDRDAHVKRLGPPVHGYLLDPPQFRSSMESRFTHRCPPLEWRSG